MVLSGLGWFAYQILGDVIGDWIFQSDERRGSRLTVWARLVIAIAIAAIVGLGFWTLGQ